MPTDKISPETRTFADAPKPANPDRRCRNCGATSGLILIVVNPLSRTHRQWECVAGHSGEAVA